MADVRWIGGAVDIYDVWTITFANTWATSDTFTLTRNGKDLVVTVGTLTGTTDVAAAVSAAFNAVNSTAGLIDDESRNVGGQEIKEFNELTATVEGSVVTITHRSPGIPVTLTKADSTAGSGSTTLSNATAATGQHFLDNADNWEGGSLPGADDVLVYDIDSSDCLYGLDYFLTNTTEVGFRRTTDCKANIGLPPFNAQYGYYEDRLRYLQLYNQAADKSINFDAGNDTSEGGSTYLDLDGQTYTDFYVHHLGARNGYLEVTGGTYNPSFTRGRM